MLPGRLVHRFVSPAAHGWLQLLLATPVVLWAGWPFFERGSASAPDLNMFTLIGSAPAPPFYSVVAMLVPGSSRPLPRHEARWAATSRRRR